MARLPQIRGMLLEEAVLYLLRWSGYKTVNAPNGDPTLYAGSAGLEVMGRGGTHQIDAIADYVIAHPFSHPQRLLVEAKFKKGRIGIEVARNAIGVLKDVGEYWVTTPNNPSKNVLGKNISTTKNRFHYQYAIFSASGYTDATQFYAFAQDVYLIPVDSSRFMQPIIESIRDLKISHRGKLKDLRDAVRAALETRENEGLFNILSEKDFAQVAVFLERAHRLDQALLGMLSNQFPVFLVRNPEVNVTGLPSQLDVRIYRNEEGWYLRDTNQRTLFSFDIPKTLFDLYADEGLLKPARALDLKEDYLSEIQAIIQSRNGYRVLTMKLDQGWIGALRERIR